MSFSNHCYLLMSVDPVHIGAGGMRLGRVDNSIVREPGTRLPKIPGTSLSGAVRQYAAYRYDKRQCAGQGQGSHCRQPTCPICYTFGFVKGEGSDQQAHSGVVSIGDARLLLFPVYSMAGPVWVTSPSVLDDFGIKGQSVAGDKAWWHSAITDQSHLNLGWLMVEKESDLGLNGLPSEIPQQVRDRIVLISDKLFSQVINSNLEVRTSVAINPETGAAEDKALFTYEAIPRAAFLWLDVVVDDYRAAFPNQERLEKWLKEDGKDFAPDEKPNRDDLNKAGWKDDEAKETLEKYRTASLNWDDPVNVVSAGLEWAEHLGIGGMGTRGFGRIRKTAEVQK